jgi:tetratricopeptide (TPR) repeat protein
MGKLEELLSYTEKCAKKYPNDVEIRFYIGLAFYARGDLQEAKRELEAAASINPHYRELVSAYLEAIEEHEMLDPAAQSH